MTDKIKYDMPSFEGLFPVEYPDRLEKFMETVDQVGGHVVLAEDGADINGLIRSIYPDASVIASSLPYIEATIDPDDVQTMKERAVLFISESLVIIVDRNDIVCNMHEAYSRIQMSDYGYGCFISGPSKTADIAQALVMGAQAARDVTVIIR